MRQTLAYLVPNDTKWKIKFSLRLQYMLLGENMGREIWHKFSVVSKYQQPSVVMNINETFYQLKRSVRTFIPGMC